MKPNLKKDPHCNVGETWSYTGLEDFGDARITKISLSWVISFTDVKTNVAYIMHWNDFKNSYTRQE